MTVRKAITRPELADDKTATACSPRPLLAAAYGKRVVRRKVYGKEMGLTRSILKAFGLSK